MEEVKQEIPLKEKVDLLMEAVQTGKIKQLKLGKAKVRTGKIKKGWIGVLKVEENGNISGEKVQVQDFAFKLKNGTYHATDGRETVLWQGKFPVVVQQTWRLNPINFFKKEGEANETYGQKYVMAKMLKDAIIMKKGGGGNIIIWILVIGAIIFGVNYFFGK